MNVTLAKRILLIVLHYLWVRRDNLYTLYKHYKTNSITFKDFTDFIDNENWAILDENSISDNDYLLWSVEHDSLNKHLNNIKPDNVIYGYNQASTRRTRMACTLYWNIWAVSDLTEYKFSHQEILEICDIAEKDYGWSESRGWYIFKWVDCVRNYWNNNNPDKQIVSFRINLKTDTEILNKLEWKKTLVIWYRTTREHYVDSQDNWVLDKKCFISCWAKQLWGHCIRYNNQENIDNYKGHKKYNAYYNNNLQFLSKEWTYFKYAYVYFYKNDVKDIIKKSDYDKYLERWFIEHPQPNRVLTEKLYGTLRERELAKNYN